ncbi:ferritin-like domain-containing protein [Qaidamihabitans albus]|uniref:ferritin-like domain-containing protein n=1 Tax=Qaidamihabitans albus TaxID=2795733 RepID=UPI0018F1439B|nr:ferritin-like domain-containing protein [Qaidamihabitans albus]
MLVMRTVTWLREFESRSEARRVETGPDWTAGARLAPAVVRSVQRFQVGESGDGAGLVRKAARAGDADYTSAVRLFVAEERHHADLLARLLAAANAPTIAAHWSDTVFVRLRRALGLRLELLVLMVAEVIALRYYRALRDGADDPLTADVADRILADERRHVPFHRDHLRALFAGRAGVLRPAVALAWWAVFLGATVTVTLDHGRALRHLGVRRAGFARDAVRLAAPVIRDVLSARRG